MATRNLLYKQSIRINDQISVGIPTVKQVLEDEDAYYGMVQMITATPYDMMVQLDDRGIDYTTINDYELFLMVFYSLREQDTSLIFGDLNLREFELVTNTQNGLLLLRNAKTGAEIDRAIHERICSALRTIHHLERTRQKPANEAARKFLLERARKKMQRRKNKEESSQLEELIIALVNTEQFPYDFGSVGGLSIYQFNESLQQIIKKIDYDNRMRGVYFGTVSAKEMSQSDLNWLTHKK